MRTIKINDIAVKSSIDNFDKELAQKIVNYVLENKKEKEEVDKIIVAFDEEHNDFDLDVEYIQPNKIERLRRITGYLTTTLDKWNHAKQCEEKDRVTHI